MNSIEYYFLQFIYCYYRVLPKCCKYTSVIVTRYKKKFTIKFYKKAMPHLKYVTTLPCEINFKCLYPKLFVHEN